MEKIKNFQIKNFCCCRLVCFGKEKKMEKRPADRAQLFAALVQKRIFDSGFTAEFPSSIPTITCTKLTWPAWSRHLSALHGTELKPSCNSRRYEDIVARGTFKDEHKEDKHNNTETHNDDKVKDDANFI